MANGIIKRKWNDNNRAPSKISELFVRTNMSHSHYTRFSAAGNFYVQRSRLNHLLLYFSRSGVRIWNKIPPTLLEQRKDPFKRKLHKLLIKVLETKKVYVDMSTITSSYLNSLIFSQSVLLPYICRCYLLFIYFICLLFTSRSFAEFIGRFTDRLETRQTRQLLVPVPPEY